MTFENPNPSVDLPQKEEEPAIHPDMEQMMINTRRQTDYIHATNEANRRASSNIEQGQRERRRELENPHSAKDPKDFGFGENVTELKNAVLGGVRDTASSALTLGERGYDMLRGEDVGCLLYTSPSPRDGLRSRMPSSA